MYMLQSIMNRLDEEFILNIESSHDSSEIVIEDGSKIDPNLIFHYTLRLKYLRSNIFIKFLLEILLKVSI